ncbi:MAG: phosphatidate cytidylyltransferase [Thermoguttaceae bacterium]|nr:phosphatidate cytidylyltransferase [Thermoguttaceae bacterium]
MLKWRLLIGIPSIALITLLCWLDANNPFPGIYLMPFFLLCVFFLCDEVLDLLNAGGVHPRRSTVYFGTLTMMILCWLACLRSFPHVREEGWNVAALACLQTLLAMAGGVVIAFIGEMIRFKNPGGITINLAGALFVITYIGMLGCFMIMLRIAYGIGAVLSLVIVTKLCDIGAYTVGRLCGRHKLAPDLSPGKTIEGGIGGLLFAVLGTWITMELLFPYLLRRESNTPLTGLILFGVLVGLTGALGDLAESLIKRDVGRKDSSSNLPGFGGFLDLFDSLLLAAPVAFAMWAYGLIR